MPLCGSDFISRRRAKTATINPDDHQPGGSRAPARYENCHKESRWTKRPRYSDRITERQMAPRSSCADQLNPPPRSGPSRGAGYRRSQLMGGSDPAKQNQMLDLARSIYK